MQGIGFIRQCLNVLLIQYIFYITYAKFSKGSIPLTMGLYCQGFPENRTERDGDREKDRETHREIYFKKLAHVIVETSKNKLTVSCWERSWCHSSPKAAWQQNSFFLGRTKVFIFLKALNLLDETHPVYGGYP